MKRKILLLAAIFVCFILQTTLLARGTIISAVPNLLLIITVSIAFIYGRKNGLLCGFLCGLFFDIYYGQVLGMYALIFMYIGFGCGFCSKVYYDEDLRIPLLLVGASDIVYNILVYIIGFLLRGRLAFGQYLIDVIFPELAATLIASIIMYRIIYLIHKALKKKDMKGRHKSWLKG